MSGSAGCSCGRPLIARVGDLTATCGECRSNPDHCDCDRLAGAGVMSAADPTGPPLGGKEFWDYAPGLTMIRDWARARRAGPYALLGEVLLQVAARIPPQIVLPPLGTGTGAQGCASLNQLYASVGPSGLSKGLGHQLAGEIVAWADPAPVYAPLGTGEGIAATYVACQRDEHKQYVMVRLAWSAVFSATEVDRLAGLLGRKSATLAGVLRSVWSGEPIGEANASEDRRRYVARHAYRAGIVVHVQPGRGGVLLNADETAAGTPQRILWLPAVDPDVPDVALNAPDRLTWTPPGPVKTALSELETRGLDDLDNIDPVVIPVCAAARAEIDRAAVARHRGETDALDGHALLVQEKLAAVLGAYLGQWGVSDETWQLAGHLMQVSGRTRAAVAHALAAAAERANEARGHAEARRAQIVDDAREAAGHGKVKQRVRDLLRDQKDWIAGAKLRRMLSERHRPDFAEVVAELAREGIIERRATSRQAAGHGGKGYEYRLAARHPGHPGHPGPDQGKQASPRTVTPDTPAGQPDTAATQNRRSDRGGEHNRRSDRGGEKTAAGVTGETAGQRRGVRGVRGDGPGTGNSAVPATPEPEPDRRPEPPRACGMHGCRTPETREYADREWYCDRHAKAMGAKP